MSLRCLAFPLLFLWGLPSIQASCSRVAQRIINPPTNVPYSCIADASILQPASMLELNNGSCLMFDVCSAPAKTSEVPLYAMMPNDEPMMLLRTHAEGRVSPYQLLKSGASNASLIAHKQLMDCTRSYRSPLLDEYPTLFSRIQLVMSNGSQTHVNLTFEVDRSKRVTQENSWFAKDKLQASFPWDLQKLKRSVYMFFSLSGFDSSDINLRFYIRLDNSPQDCNSLSGYIVVVEKSLCPFFETSYHTSYQWVPNGTSPGSLPNFRNRELSLEFRLHGEPVEPFRWYQRL